jgi:hypothetical protein
MLERLTVSQSGTAGTGRRVLQPISFLEMAVSVWHNTTGLIVHLPLLRTGATHARNFLTDAIKDPSGLSPEGGARRCVLPQKFMHDRWLQLLFHPNNSIPCSMLNLAELNQMTPTGVSARSCHSGLQKL